MNHTFIPKYNELNLKEKLEVIKELAAGSLLQKVAHKFNVSPATVANIKKKKDFYAERALANDPLDMKCCARVKGNGAIIEE